MARLASYLFLAAQVLLLARAQDSSFDYSQGDADYYGGDPDYYEGDSDYSSDSNSATCYFPSGDVAFGNVPCNPDAEVSTCCGDASSCLANGLCAVGDTSDGLGGFLNSGVEFARGACTDPTWQDPACFQHCLSSQPGSPDSNGAAVFECGSEGYAHAANYCCENGIDAKTACCATPSLIFELGPGTYGSMPPPTSSPVAPEPPATVTTTLISDSSYSVPQTSPSGSPVPLTSVVGSSVTSARASLFPNGTLPTVTPRTSAVHGSNSTATAAPSAFTGAAGKNKVSLMDCGAVALAALFYL